MRLHKLQYRVGIRPVGWSISVQYIHMSQNIDIYLFSTFIKYINRKGFYNL